MNGCLPTTSEAIRTVDWSGDTGKCWACSKLYLIRRHSSWKAVMRRRNPMRRQIKLIKPSAWRKCGGRVLRDTSYSSAFREKQSYGATCGLSSPERCLQDSRGANCADKDAYGLRKEASVPRRVIAGHRSHCSYTRLFRQSLLCWHPTRA